MAYTQAGEECPICMEEIGLTSILFDRCGCPSAESQCYALFHSACLQRWLDTYPNCPNCRGSRLAIGQPESIDVLQDNVFLIQHEDPREDLRMFMQKFPMAQVRGVESFEQNNCLIDALLQLVLFQGIRQQECARIKLALVNAGIVSSISSLISFERASQILCLHFRCQGNHHNHRTYAKPLKMVNGSQKKQKKITDKR